MFQPNSHTESALEAIVAEYKRQIYLRDVEKKFEHTAQDSACSDLTRIVMLTEELGEVARAMQNDDMDNLWDELSQVAAVSVAWMAYLSKEFELYDHSAAA